MSEYIDYTCPVCGSTNYEIVEKTSTIQAPYGPVVEYEDDKYKCNVCEITSGFSVVKNNTLKKAYDESTRKSIPLMLKYLEDNGLRLVDLERIFGIPFGSLSAENVADNISPERISLLRILRTYPWISLVADRNYDEDFSIEVVKNAGMVS